MIQKIFTNKYFEMNRGYIVLMSVLIFGAVSMAIVISIVLLGVSSSRTSFAHDQEVQSEILATACTEEAIQKIIDTTVLNTSDTLPLGSGSCNYVTTLGGDQTVTIQATGFSGSIIKKIKVLIATTTPVIVVSSWQEVDNF